jgi:hypothetical protein
LQQRKDPFSHVLLAIAKRLSISKDITTAAEGSLGSFVTPSTFDSLDGSQDVLSGYVRDQAITKQREKVVLKSSPNALCVIRGFTVQRKDLRQPLIGYDAELRRSRELGSSAHLVNQGRHFSDGIFGGKRRAALAFSG